MAQSISVRASTFIVRELVGEILYFPVWWYTAGTKEIWTALVRQWLGLSERLGLRLLLQSMGKPMYGDYTRTGRIISFFFRIFLVAIRFVLVAGWTLISILLFVIWLVAPIAVLALLLRQLIPA